MLDSVTARGYRGKSKTCPDPKNKPNRTRCGTMWVSQSLQCFQ